MLINVSHEQGLKIEQADEIVFETPFDYMFRHLQRSESCFLRTSNRTITGLHALGAAMADPGEVGDEHTELNSNIPAGYTYLGQFIDHDITARTDREVGVSRIVLDGDDPITPLDPDQVTSQLTNGRRPQLDLDSVYGDGPGLIAGVQTEASGLYVAGHALDVNSRRGYVDVPRDAGRARIADMRNDENVMVSQLQAAFLSLHNEVLATTSGSDAARYARARQLVRWAYQYVVVNDYLKQVCDPGIVDDILYNGPRFFTPASSGGELFMPLEFSVAGFRFGHSMIRPFYELNSGSGQIPVLDLLEAGSANNQLGGELRPDRVIDWDSFVGGSAQRARIIDPKLARGLFELPFGDCDPVLAHLARRNLLRAYLLRIPTGQACAAAMGIVPLKGCILGEGESPQIQAALTEARFTDRTPLWYYVLKEAAIQKNGQSLGAVGSRIVAETLIGLVKADRNSYLNSCCDPAVHLRGDHQGIDVRPGHGGLIRDLPGLIAFAKVPPT